MQITKKKKTLHVAPTLITLPLKYYMKTATENGEINDNELSINLWKTWCGGKGRGGRGGKEGEGGR